MDFRQFFTSNTWWGKLIGAFLGHLVAGPVGAFFGVLIGNFFDRGLYLHFSRPHWHYHAERRSTVQQIFFEATFSVMGHIAKADGLVSIHEIEMAKKLMQEMDLKQAEIIKAQNYFNKGKVLSPFALETLIRTLKEALHDNLELLKLFIDLQYRAALVDGLTSTKQRILNKILIDMGFSPLQRQYQFYEDFVSHSAYQRSRSSSSAHEERTQQKRYSTLDHAYAILNIPKTANKQEVKRAYRQLISRNHPDKLIAKGLPEAMIKIANEKTQAITKAYEEICANKGW